jgi:hypothetical protein
VGQPSRGGAEYADIGSEVEEQFEGRADHAIGIEERCRGRESGAGIRAGIPAIRVLASQYPRLGCFWK